MRGLISGITGLRTHYQIGGYATQGATTLEHWPSSQLPFPLSPSLVSNALSHSPTPRSPTHPLLLLFPHHTLHSTHPLVRFSLTSGFFTHLLPPPLPIHLLAPFLFTSLLHPLLLCSLVPPSLPPPCLPPFLVCLPPPPLPSSPAPSLPPSLPLSPTPYARKP